MTTKPTHPFLSGNEIRSRFLDYFAQHQHTVVHSSSLVPHNDPTLLFTNAGMVQFKDVFLGKEERPYHRAASSQRCVRAGGKHNDLENVGFTARHHTFFEMLGNFSFGDYFKREAIQLAWKFLTIELNLPAEKLWVTVYEHDQEAEHIWLNEMHIDPSRFSRCGDNDNFWAMGATGPCGPCSEIFYDHGPAIAGGPPGSPDADGDRYVEIWNLVFMQYNRDESNQLTPLPKPSVDTGMGLERISAVMQHVQNNYDTDLFIPLISAISDLAGMADRTHFSLRVIADHIRSTAFLITDGITPGNEGRAYVLRRIIRRALRHGHQLGIPTPFFYKLVAPLIHIMGKNYPELETQKQHIEMVLTQEEEQFSTTLVQGLKVFEQAIANLSEPIIPGEIAFKLYDTFGFPIDLTQDLAKEKNVQVDLAEFEVHMEAQRNRSRQSSHFHADRPLTDHDHQATEFIGYQNLEKTETEPVAVLALYKDGQFTSTLHAGDRGTVLLNRSPFYAESGGQVGDQGHLKNADGVFFEINDTIKQGQTHLHLGKLNKGQLTIGDHVIASVNAKRRDAILLNHTATHLLHHVLRNTLGKHAEQKGSLVDAERMRFDFSHPKPLTEQELKTIERSVNAEIRANHLSTVRTSSYQEAIDNGAIGLFEDKYGSKVRVVSFGDSVELCGGTHAESTGNIGLFKITSESGVAAGIRRIEAVTGEAALNYIEQCELGLQKSVSSHQEKIAALEKEISDCKRKMAGTVLQEAILQRQQINDITVISAQMQGVDGKMLRSGIDHLKQELKSGVFLLVSIKENKLSLIASVTDDHSHKIKANELMRFITQKVQGKGGGKADLAEGGGIYNEHLDEYLKIDVPNWIREQLA